jgi:hypothetical protein
MDKKSSETNSVFWNNIWRFEAHLLFLNFFLRPLDHGVFNFWREQILDKFRSPHSPKIVYVKICVYCIKPVHDVLLHLSHLSNEPSDLRLVAHHVSFCFKSAHSVCSVSPERKLDPKTSAARAAFSYLITCLICQRTITS